MTACAVNVCGNYKKKQGLSFHKFPNDQSLMVKWYAACLPQKPLTKNSVVCSEHFKEDDFKDAQYKVMARKGERKLKPTAVPSLNLSSKVEDINCLLIVTEDPCEDMENILPKAYFQSAEEPDESALESDEFEYEASQSDGVEYEASLQSDEVENKKTFHLKDKTYKYEEEVIEPEEGDINEKMKHLQDEILRKDIEIQLLQEENNKLKSSNIDVTSFLTHNQIAVLSGDEEHPDWNEVEMSSALTLRCLSKESYVYLRSNLNYPLPNIQTVEQWATKIDTRNGLQSNSLTMMQFAGKDQADFDKTTVLLFDELDIKSVYEYDESNDKVIGPHTKILVVMARGLFISWKQPVYVSFDNKINKTILLEIISELNKINYNVVACVSICHVDLWNELSIDFESPYVENPETSDKVHFFVDSHYLLKEIRNWMIDTGFNLENGEKVSVDPIKEIIQSPQTGNRLSYQHISGNPKDRQNLLLTTQLFSHETAIALSHNFPGPDGELAQDTGLFIEMICQWFQMMNSSVLDLTSIQSMPYGLNIEEQDLVLDHVYVMIGNMRCMNSQNFQEFQTGFLMTINSLKNLYRDMYKKYNIDYIFTHRTCLEPLEDFFKGLNNTNCGHIPTPLEALSQMKLILLGKNATGAENDEDYFIMTEILKKLDMITDSDEEFDNSFKAVHFKTEGRGKACLTSWVATKFRQKYPNMEYSGEKFDQLEDIFKSAYRGMFSHECVKNCENIRKTLIEVCRDKIPELPEDVIKAYVVQRIYIRVNCLNKELERKQIKKGKYLNSINGRKKLKIT